MQETFMKRRLLTYTLLSLAALALFSCKKDDKKTETKPYLYGVNFNLPTFASPGDPLKLVPYGVYTKDGKELKAITYKWKINSNADVEQESFTFTPEKTGNYTITCEASDPDGNYYTTSTAKVVIVIDPALGKTHRLRQC